MSESKYWWAFVDEWGTVKYHYGTFYEASTEADTVCLAGVVKVEFYEPKETKNG